MIKVLDYHYLVLLRHYDNWYKKDSLSYKVPFIMSLTLTVNISSFAILFNNHILDYFNIWMIFCIICILIDVAIDKVYNKKRREMIREKYKDESPESRQLGVVKVVIYEVLSFAFLILSISTLKRPHS